LGVRSSPTARLTLLAGGVLITIVLVINALAWLTRRAGEKLAG
jgi:hypothetical protein